MSYNLLVNFSILDINTKSKSLTGWTMNDVPDFGGHSVWLSDVLRYGRSSSNCRLSSGRNS